VRGEKWVNNFLKFLLLISHLPPLLVAANVALATVY